MAPKPGISKSELLSLLSLKDKELAQKGFFIAEGQFLCQRAREAGCEILATADHRENTSILDQNHPAYYFTKEQLAEVLGYKFHRGLLALIKRPALPPAESLTTLRTRRVLVLPHIGNQENMGNLIRSAACLGTDLLLIGRSSVDPLGRKALRVSMGHIFFLPYAFFTNFPELTNSLKKQGFSMVLADSNEPAQNLDDFRFPEKTALIMGEEAFGFGASEMAEADYRVKIPLSDKADSLNVAMAGAILLYEWQKKRT